jgi:hypothetical protein
LKTIENREFLIKQLKIEDRKKPNMNSKVIYSNIEGILINLREISLLLFEMLIKWSKNLNLSSAFKLRSFKFLDGDYFEKVKLKEK